jgi:hypothetical protein
MIPANATVNSLTRDTVDANGRTVRGERMNITTSLQTSIANNGFFLALNAIQEPKQQKMLQAGLQYVMSYRFFMSGQQSSDKEYLNMMKITFEQAGDSDETIRQKRMMRQMQINALLEVAGGAVDPVQVLNEAIEVMRVEDMNQEFITAMQRERNIAAEHARARAAGVSDTIPVSNAILTGGGILDFGTRLLDSLTVIDSTLAGGRR